MTAQPLTPEPEDSHEVIHLGGQAAVVVPMAEYLKLRTLERQASPQDVAAAQAEAEAVADWQARQAEGQTSYLTMQEFRAQLGLPR